MRIIAGKWKGKLIEPVPGFTARPTTSYLREVVFTVIQDWEGKLVLDLYSGTGALAWEALSRGSAFADLVDASPISFEIMMKNMRLFKFANSCRLHRKKVMTFIKGCEKKFDVIFVDPPYAKDLINPTIDAIMDKSLLAEEGYLVVEHAPREKVSDRWFPYITYQKRHGVSTITVLSAHPAENQVLENEEESHEDI